MKEMKKIKKLFNEILLSSQYDSVDEDFQEMGKEDKEMYLFMRGGFAAK